MEQDIAKEPVDRNGDLEFMDTGILYEDRVCTECSNDLALKGHRMCSDCLKEKRDD